MYVELWSNSDGTVVRFESESLGEEGSVNTVIKIHNNKNRGEQLHISKNKVFLLHQNIFTITIHKPKNNF